MFDLILKTVESNSVIAGTLSLMLTGSLLYLLKSFPILLFQKIISFFTTTVTITNNNVSYYKFLQWFEKSPYRKYSRTVQFSNGKWGYDDKTILSAGQGNHYFIFENKIMKASIVRQKDTVSDNVKEEVIISYLGRNHKYAEFLLKKLSEPKIKNSDIYTVYTYNEGWREICTEYKRKFSTIFIDPCIKNKITNHIDYFLKNKKEYIEKGKPYRTTIILHGQPGTGKTSIIKAIASLYNLNISLIEPGNVSGIKKALCSSPSNSLVAIEDVDSISGVLNREGASKNEKALEIFNASKTSEILNALDGIGSFNDKILIMTTNHLDKLDPAFLRPGRVDLILEIPSLNVEDLNLSDTIRSKISSSTIKGCELEKIMLS